MAVLSYMRQHHHITRKNTFLLITFMKSGERGVNGSVRPDSRERELMLLKITARTKTYPTHPFLV